MEKKKPTISYWESGDPTLEINNLKSKLTEINIIRTKVLNDNFVRFLLENKNKIFLHLTLTGMGQTMFEPNIPTVRNIFRQLQTLIINGFNPKQILVIVNPVLQNDNGLKAIQLLLKLFSEYKELRLRYMRFNILQYRNDKDGKPMISNYNIVGRYDIKRLQNFLKKSDYFYKEYTKLLQQYRPIIYVDNGEEPLIGIKELLPFGYKNEWIENGKREKLITYKDNNRYKPVVNIISGKTKRCQNKCVLCPYKG